MNIKEFLINQAKRAGVADDPEFQLMISASALSDIMVPDAVEQKFNTNLMDSELAKTSLDLKKHFIGSYMQGYDEEIINLAKQYGLDQQSIDELKITKNSGDKVKIAFKKLKDLEEKAKQNTNKDVSDEYMKKIAEAQAKVDEAMQKVEIEKSLIADKYIAKMKQLWEQTQLSGIQWNDNVPEAARIPAYQSVIEQKLNQLQGKILYDPENNRARLVNSNDESLPLVVNGKEFSYNDLSLLVLQENKLLKEKPIGGTIPDFTQGTIPPTAFVPQTQGTPNIPAHIRSALADISNVAQGYNQ
ncbi:hypothetical protein EB118_09070 [bacterium]|nr:hypothetical protein [bacterium]NDD84043.1 hypothetical protein [bacterium]NDG30212.1 hypothetical protein [bacterium]